MLLLMRKARHLRMPLSVSQCFIFSHKCLLIFYSFFTSLNGFIFAVISFPSFDTSGPFEHVTCTQYLHFNEFLQSQVSVFVLHVLIRSRSPRFEQIQWVMPNKWLILSTLKSDLFPPKISTESPVLS